MRVKATFREYENGGTKGFVDFAINGNLGIKGAVLLDGENGMFINLPTVHVKDGYREVVTGVSREFKDLLLEAALAARNDPEHRSSIGERSDLYYEPHVTALNNPGKKTKALASLTVREGKDAEKSAFTISDIRIMEGNEGRLFVAMPSVKTDNPEFPYNNLCYMTTGSRNFISSLILREAKKELGIGKPSLDDNLRNATNEKNSAWIPEAAMREQMPEREAVMR